MIRYNVEKNLVSFLPIQLLKHGKIGVTFTILTSYLQAELLQPGPRLQPVVALLLTILLLSMVPIVLVPFERGASRSTTTVEASLIKETNLFIFDSNC